MKIEQKEEQDLEGKLKQIETGVYLTTSAREFVLVNEQSINSRRKSERKVRKLSAF